MLLQFLSCQCCQPFRMFTPLGAPAPLCTVYRNDYDYTGVDSISNRFDENKYRGVSRVTAIREPPPPKDRERLRRVSSAGLSFEMPQTLVCGFFVNDCFFIPLSAPFSPLSSSSVSPSSFLSSQRSTVNPRVHTCGCLPLAAVRLFQFG